MRYCLPAFIFFSFFISSVLRAQEWRLYSATDAVRDFAPYQGQLWIISGSGLTRMSITTQERTTWNVLNSDIPDCFYNKMAIDSNGHVWLLFIVI